MVLLPGDTSMDTAKEMATKYSLYDINCPTFHDAIPTKSSTLDLPEYEIWGRVVS